MKQFIKTYWKTLLFFVLVGLVGGFFVGFYTLNTLSADMQEQLIISVKEAGLDILPIHILLAIVTSIQSAGYGLILGALGIWLGKKTGLWKDERDIQKKPLLVTLLAALFGGLMLILPDLLFFGKYSQVILDSYATKPTFDYILASVTYGGVIEEVMLRLFMMSLVTFLLHKLFEKGKDTPSTTIYIIANAISALLFAAGHLPATVMMIGTTPLIIFRCFLLNGAFGYLFGWLYHKYGLRYAMICHAGCHLVSKLIWILFI